MAQTVPNLCVSKKVFLKHQVNWYTVCCATLDLPWCNIWLADNLKFLNKHLSLLVRRFVPIKFIMCATRISLGLTINAGVLLASCMGLIFGGAVIAFELTENSLSALSSES